MPYFKKKKQMNELYDFFSRREKGLAELPLQNVKLLKRLQQVVLCGSHNALRFLAWFPPPWRSQCQFGARQVPITSGLLTCHFAICLSIIYYLYLGYIPPPPPPHTQRELTYLPMKGDLE